MTPSFFISAIGTDCGKTIASAVLVQALQADYFKPIQSGDLDASDSLRIRELISNPISRIWPETYRLSEAMSPHASAKRDGLEISLENIKLPETRRPLIVEGAGGLLVPLNDRPDFIGDLILRLKLPLILVVNFYLGSINHTLLSLAYLRFMDIPLHGIIFSGTINEDSKAIILQSVPDLKTLHIPHFEEVNASEIRTYCLQNKSQIDDFIRA